MTRDAGTGNVGGKHKHKHKHHLRLTARLRELRARPPQHAPLYAIHKRGFPRLEDRSMTKSRCRENVGGWAGARGEVHLELEAHARLRLEEKRRLLPLLLLSLLLLLLLFLQF